MGGQEEKSFPLMGRRMSAQGSIQGGRGRTIYHRKGEASGGGGRKFGLEGRDGSTACGKKKKCDCPGGLFPGGKEKDESAETFTEGEKEKN